MEETLGINLQVGQQKERGTNKKSPKKLLGSSFIESLGGECVSDAHFNSIIEAW